MDNYTSTKEIHILPFYRTDENKAVIFTVFAFIYLTGLLMNTAIITVICIDAHLHTPMYVLLCNLSFVDMCYTTVTMPKLLDMLLSGNNTVSFTQCFTQMYFLFLAAGSEDFLLLTMAYDRYVAICNPLQYHSIMSKKMCLLFMTVIWLYACLHSSLITISASKMYFCHSNTIQNFYCDAKALTNIACGGTEVFYTVIYIEVLLIGLLPFLCSLTSYSKILKIIFNIKSIDGRRKAFSTCSSHLIVIIMFYSTGTSVYMIPTSDNYSVLEQICTVLYTTVTPMLNPLIYSFKNKDIKCAVLRLLGIQLNNQV
ncbi:olfactory receptor 1-like [Mixophyes fleayi]|uniref:olfactory receptor 1-like n=1 Tax=Mixophyes fleayi TaxID=3061075 RepID=UPI003F4D7B25